MNRVLLFAAALALSASPSYAQWSKISKGLGLDKQDQLSDDTVVSGLKDALKIGAGNAVDLTGRVDGYFRNEAIKILLPESLRKMDKGLRLVGYGPQMDEFVLSMNRAAEKAAPFARDIFWDAIKEMTFEDARGILKGGETSATDYFKAKTSQRLAEAFRPVVERSMQEVGVTRRFKELVGQFESIPFARSDAFDIDTYVVDKSLDGLFHVLGEQEKEIRQNPAARVTDLLKKVFGK